MIVCGGVYEETCIDPDWHQVFGSGGRAAAVLGPASAGVKLVTYAPNEQRQHIEELGSVYQFAAITHETSSTITFDYVHGLSVPLITPLVSSIQLALPIEVSDDVVLRFGMIEGDSRVRGKTVVYDPQSAFNPRPFAENGSKAEKLALVLNGAEARRLSGLNEAESAAVELLSRDGADAVVVKLGSHGAVVATTSGTRKVPAYRSSRVWPIGSGDVFAAAFTFFWAMESMDAADAADLASRATSAYCEDRSFPALSVASLAARVPITPTPGRVYLAGAFFSLHQRWMIEETRAALASQGLAVFSPLHDVGWGTADEVAPKDLEGLDRCDRVLALIDDKDVGTIFEVGYARARQLPVIAFSQSLTPEALKMIEGSGCKVVNDFVTAIYETAWL